MAITIQPKPLTELAEKMMSGVRPFDDDEFPKGFWVGRTWTCEMEKCMKEREWQRKWKGSVQLGKDQNI
jgi:hypothetical protein